MLTICVRLMLTVATTMLVIVGITYLFTGEELSLVNPILGPAGDAVLTAVIATTLAAASWMLTGVTIAGCLLVGYAVVLLFLRDTREPQLVTARMLLSAVLITVGIFAVVITGETEPEDRLARGLIPTIGAALIVVPMAGVLTGAWRAGHRPALNGVGGWAVLIVRLIAGMVLIGWLTVSVGSAWVLEVVFESRSSCAVPGRADRSGGGGRRIPALLKKYGVCRGARLRREASAQQNSRFEDSFLHHDR